MSDAENYQVLARKYRPQTFSELTGQEHVRRTLQNAIDSGRVAHAFLFTGARGVGKTSTARILARALNCEKGISVEPCNVCPQCVEIREGSSTDVFEIDGASNTGVDDIRELRDNVRYLPSHSRFKIFIIDEVHMLTNNAFNALLKTLEEPPAHVKFIFATTEPHKLPVTILSRCQRLDFKRVGISAIVGRLREIAGKECVSISDSALALIARKGDGSMRDSLTAFDQVLSFCGSTVSDDDVTSMIGAVDRRLLFALSDSIFKGHTQGVLQGIKEVDTSGYNMRQFCQELLDHFRNLLVIRSVDKPEDILDLTDAELSELKNQSVGHSILDIQRRLTLILKADSDMAFSSFQRLILEVALLKATMLPPIVPITELMERLKNMQTSAVHTPDLPWNAEIKPSTGRTLENQGSTHLNSYHTSSRETSQSHTAIEPGKSVPSIPVKAMHQKHTLQSHADWETFIQFFTTESPANGSILEHGSPIKLDDKLLELGFPDGSYYLTAARDADFIKDVEETASKFTGGAISVKIKEISPETGGVPLSLVEKKKSEQQEKLDSVTKELSSHPIITEATRLFGGKITDIRLL